MKPFPTLWYVGNVAMFDVGKHRVVVPLKFGSSDRAEHFVALLYRLWQEHPFSVRKGVLVQRYTKQIDGVRKEVEENVAHRLFAAYAHQDIGFEWTEVTAKNGNFLCLTAENVVPVRDPNAPATDAEKEHTAQQEMRAHQFDGSFPFMMRFFAKFLRTQRDILTTEQLIELQTASVQTLLTAERLYAADLTRDDVEQQNFFERKLSLMARSDLAVARGAKPEDFPDGVVHLPPVHSTKSPDMDDMIDDGLFDHCIKVRLENDVSYVEFTDHITKHNVRRDAYRADLQGRWNDPSTEAVLNRHGWFTPPNGGKPTYEGKVKVWGNLLVSGKGKAAVAALQGSGLRNGNHGTRPKPETAPV